MNARQQLKLRLWLSLAFGLTVAGVALSTVGGAQSRDVNFHQKNTRRALRQIDSALAQYRADKGRYPPSLGALKLDGETARDGWRRAWVYSLPQGQPLVESLGRDGKRGGIGTDADLSNRNPRPPATRVPFWIRVTEPEAWPMTVVALFCGVLSGVLARAGLRHTTFEAKELVLVAPVFLTALGLAVFGAAVITMLHVPSGH